MRDRVPKPILNAHRHQTTSVTQNATKVSIMLFTDQRFCITPPYSTASPGRLISPTKVAAVICHALSPALSQLGYASQDMGLHFLRFGLRGAASREYALATPPRTVRV